MCTDFRARQSGLSLIELIIAMVIIGLALAGTLSVFNTVAINSVDPVTEKQAQTLADSLLEEIQLAAFGYCDGDDENVLNARQAVLDAARANAQQCWDVVDSVGPEGGEVRPFDNVNDYVTAFGTATNIACVDAAASMAMPAGYACSVTIVASDLGTIGAGSGDALRITVEVVGPSGTMWAEGYRVRHVPQP